MKKWEPISEIELFNIIQKDEPLLKDELWNFWQLIRIHPEKWMEESFGVEGGGFWVVAICGRKIIWYNDIEDGFNISEYKEYGQISEYVCDKDEINWAVIKLFNLVKTGGDIVWQTGPPEKLDGN